MVEGTSFSKATFPFELPGVWGEEHEARQRYLVTSDVRSVILKIEDRQCNWIRDA